MFIIVLLLLISSLKVYAVVDYWGIAPNSFKKNKPKEKVIEVKTKRESKPSGVKEIKKEDLIKESIKWYEEKIKKEKPPVEYYYFKDPEKYSEEYIKWIQWKQAKINDLIRPVLRHTRISYVESSEIIEVLKRKGYILFYFYRPDCSYCKAEEPEISILKEKGMKVVEINIYKHPLFALKWKVDVTPTMILVSKKEKKAFRLVGYIPAIEMLNKFYQMVESNG